jgi:hypothetical protein
VAHPSPRWGRAVTQEHLHRSGASGQDRTRTHLKVCVRSVRFVTAFALPDKPGHVRFGPVRPVRLGSRDHGRAETPRTTRESDASAPRRALLSRGNCDPLTIDQVLRCYELLENRR